MKTNPSETELMAMRGELDALKTKLAALEKGVQFSSSAVNVLKDPVVTDRRAMLKKVAGLAAGVAAVGLLQPRSSKAANGDPILIGKQNSGSGASTDLLSSNLFVSSGSSSAALVGHGNARGVTGTALSANGVGVLGVAHSGASAHAVEGLSNNGVGGLFRGLRAALYLPTPAGAVANPNNNPPTNASSGDVYRGSTNSSIWYKAGFGTNPYRRLADSGTAGALSLLAAPLRLVDTRNGSGFFDAGNPYSNGNLRVYNIVSLSVGTVPTGTRAIVARATALNSTVAAIIQESSVNPPGVGSAIINLGAGQIVGASFTGALNSSGQIFVKASLSGGTVDVILDVIGYYL